MKDSITQRCDRLEFELWRLQRASRGHKLAWCCVGLCAGIALVAGAANREEAEVVEAERFVVRDADGKARAELGVDDRENVFLFLSDANGNRSISLGVTQDGRPAMGLIQSSDKRQITLAFSPLGDGGMTLYDKNLTPRGRLFTARDGTPTVELRDPANKLVFEAP